jgi:hypothetical protein
MLDSIIAYTTFLDGSKQPVFQELGGRQYVLDNDSEQVYGTWFIPPEEAVPPIIVQSKGSDTH